jgi:hypothetical protein
MRIPIVLAAGLALLAPAVASADLIPVATYGFQNTLAASQGGVASLVSVDPLGQNGFQTDTLYGLTRQVFRFSGAASPPTSQGGLSLNATGLLPVNQYSFEAVFSFDGSTGWRRILDVQDRQSDNGFYVDPNSNLDVFPVAGGGAFFSANTYHHVVLTVATSGQVIGYLDGAQSFSANTSVMNIASATNTLNFFLDNVAGGGQGEYSPGKVGLIRLYNDVLPASQVASLAANPFGIVPEPASVTLFGLGLAGVAGLAARRFRRAA